VLLFIALYYSCELRVFFPFERQEPPVFVDDGAIMLDGFAVRFRFPKRGEPLRVSVADIKKAGHFFFLAVFADSLNALAVGAPFAPGLRIVSPLPASMRWRLA
jgi:hypothetical protein